MALDDAIVKACKGLVSQKVKSAKELRQALLDKCLEGAVSTIERYNRECSRQGIRAVGKQIAGGYEVCYSAESVNGRVRIIDSVCDTADGKRDNNAIVSVRCKAHSCETQSFYDEEIPEADLLGFIKYATREPTLTDRWKRMAGYYQGEF